MHRVPFYSGGCVQGISQRTQDLTFSLHKYVTLPIILFDLLLGEASRISWQIKKKRMCLSLSGILESLNKTEMNNVLFWSLYRTTSDSHFFFSAFTELYLRITMNRNVYCYGETLVSLYSRSIWCFITPYDVTLEIDLFACSVNETLAA